MKIIFSQQLQKLRKEKGISQEELANDLYVTRQTVSKWELGETTPNLNTIEKVAKIFQVPVEELLFGNQLDNDTSNKNGYNSPQNVKNRYHPINNVWEFLARYWWVVLIFILAFGFVFTIAEMFHK